MFVRQIKKSGFNRNILVWVLVIAITTALGIGMAEPNNITVAEDITAENDNYQSQQNSLNEPVQSINFKKDWLNMDIFTLSYNHRIH